MTAIAASDAEPRVFFDAILHPHRSLSPRGFVILMGLFTAVSLTVGGLFFAIGAWPIFGFFGVDILLFYIAFRISYRSARMYETVRLTDRELVVQRVNHTGERKTWRFQPHWLRVTMDDPPEHESQITLSSHGRSVVIGAYLTPEERLDFAKALSEALARCRQWQSQPGGRAS